MDNPTHVIIDGKRYNINTDFRVAIECNNIAIDTSINDYERALAIIYKLFGEDGLNDEHNHEKLLKLAEKYLSCGKEVQKNKKEEMDMDFEQDKGYIISSFRYDYHYNPYELEYLHWYDYFNDLNNLSNDEFGTCCVLNRVRNLRNYDLKSVKDPKEREKIRKAKEQVSLKKNNENKNKFTQEKKENIDEFINLIGIRKE